MLPIRVPQNQSFELMVTGAGALSNRLLLKSLKGLLSLQIDEQLVARKHATMRASRGARAEDFGAAVSGFKQIQTAI